MRTPVCPRCSLPLHREEIKKAKVFSCKECLGFCSTVTALKKVVARDALNKIWVESMHSPLDSELKCPSCQNSMRQIVTAVGGSPELDSCPSCYLVWLDHGELDQLPAPTPPSTSQSTDRSEYREALAKMELQKLKDRENSRHLDSTEHPGGLKTFLTLVGLPVERNDDVFEQKPYITWTLLLLATVSSIVAFYDPLFYKELYFNPSQGILHWLTNGFTVFFVHGDWIHLIGNMYFLWVFGDNVEDELGKVRFLLLVFGSTLIATWAHGFFSGFDPRPVVGASGGIYGILTFYLFRFPKRKFIVFYFFHWWVVSVWVLLGLRLFYDFMGIAAQSAGVTHVSHIAHIGGALTGMVFVSLFTDPLRPPQKNLE